jgi:hypothetical protein
MSLRSLRRIIREAMIAEIGGGIPNKPQPMTRNPMSPDINNREQIGKMETGDQEDDELAPHLMEPIYSKEDCYGPVPPDAEDPYVQQDPYVNDASPGSARFKH